jgi:phosphate-selective porin OprO/OprP
VRQTGLCLPFRNLWVHLGGTTKGRYFSQQDHERLRRLDHGTNGDRDATIPILADGIKWIGYSQEKHLVWNLGAFGDTFSEGQTFSTYSHQFVGRIAWLPIENEETVLPWVPPHATVLPSTACYSFVQGPRHLRPRTSSTPESFQPRALKHRNSRPTTALESFLIGTEVFRAVGRFSGDGQSVLSGGQVVMSWLATGEIPTLQHRRRFFDGISPARPVFQGGPGAWELVANLSTPT